MPDLKSLLEVQLYMGKLKALEIKSREEQQHVELKKLRGEINQGRAAFEKLKETYSGLKNRLKSKEMSAAWSREQADSLGQKLYSGAIINIKEIETNSKKLESLRSAVSQIEDEILEMMEEKDELRARLADIAASITHKTEAYRKMKKLLLTRQQQAKSELDKYQDRINRLIEQLEPRLWSMYQEMQKKLPDPLARVEKETCMGCRMGITYGELRLLKQGEGLVHCGNCGRILYWEGQK